MSTSHPGKQLSEQGSHTNVREAQEPRYKYLKQLTIQLIMEDRLAAMVESMSERLATIDRGRMQRVRFDVAP